MAYTSLKTLFKAICDAIRSKDGTTGLINHQDIPDRIAAITTGSTGTDTTISSNGANASDILSGKKAWVNNALITGTHTCEVNPGGTDISDASNVISSQIANGVTVYGSNGKVIGTHICEKLETDNNLVASNIKSGVSIYGVTGTFTNDADAIASDIANNKTAWVNGKKITGTHICSTPTTVTQATPTIEISSSGVITASATQTEGYVVAGTKSATKQLTTKGATTITPSVNSQTAVASGVYTTGAITVAGDSDLIASNIKSGINIFGVTGSYTGETPTTIEATALSGLHVWKKMQFDGNYELVQTEEISKEISYKSSIGGSNEWDTAKYADGIDYSTGSIVLDNPTTITIDSTDDADLLKGKYAYLSNLYGYYRIPSDATMTYNNATYNSKVTCSKLYKLSVERSGEIVGYVVSTNKSSYPENGEQDGYGYVYIGNVTV